MSCPPIVAHFQLLIALDYGTPYSEDRWEVSRLFANYLRFHSSRQQAPRPVVPESERSNDARRLASLRIGLKFAALNVPYLNRIAFAIRGDQRKLWMRLPVNRGIVPFRMLVPGTGSTISSTHITVGRAIVGVAALLAWGCCATTAQAQYRFDHWTTENGLPQNSTRDITQTPDGYLWFTTFDGLVRFDGVRFTVFNKANSPGLPSNRFVHLFDDRNGDIWASMETGEVVRLSRGRFTTYTIGRGLSEIYLPYFGEDGKGNVELYSLQWISNDGERSISNHVYRFSEGRFQPADDLSHVWPVAPVPALETSAGHGGGVVDGDVWTFGSQEGIHYLKSGGIQVYSNRNGLPGIKPEMVLGRTGVVQVLSRDTAGRLWATDLQSMHSKLLSQQTPEGRRNSNHLQG